jgi:hypothetical protein
VPLISTSSRARISCKPILIFWSLRALVLTAALRWRPGGPGLLLAAHGRGSTHGRARGAAVVPAPVVPLSQVAVDVIGLMEDLGIDRADVSGVRG